MTEFNNVGKPSHPRTEMPPEIEERAGTVGCPEVIQYSLMPRINEVGGRLQKWGESRTAGLGSREVDWRRGGGRRDKATDTLTKTAILARENSYDSPRNPACQIHAKVRKA